jgi:hypothetical protein
MAEVLDASSPPDWNTFSLDLFCPRCDYNLRTLTGSRCPECGLELDWPRIIAAAEKRVDSPLFEYRWRTQPIRSFFSTIWLCLRPWRLWSRVAITDSPRVAGLAVFLILVVALYVVISSSYVGVWVATLIASSRRPHFGMLPKLAWRAGPFFLCQTAVHFVTALILWLQMNVFQQTISKHRIKRSHLFRVILLAWVLVLTIKLIVFPMGYAYSLPLSFTITGDTLALASCVVSLSLGFQNYLKVKRSWRLVITLFLLTILTYLTIVILTSIMFESWDNPVAYHTYQTWPGFYVVLSRLLGF